MHYKYVVLFCGLLLSVSNIAIAGEPISITPNGLIPSLGLSKPFDLLNDQEKKYIFNDAHFIIEEKNWNPLQATASSSLNFSNENKTAYSEPFFTGNKLHQYLGLASLLAAVASLPTIPADESDGSSSLHHRLAVTSYGLGLAAVVTGFIFHYDDVFKYGITDTDNLHMLLGIVGTLGYFGSVALAPENTHAAAGAVGIVSMGVSILIVW